MANFQITVLKHSASGKSAFCRVSTKVGAFVAPSYVGYLRVADGEELPAISTSFTFEGTVERQPMQDVDKETGEATPRTTKAGDQLYELVLIPATT